MLNAEQVEKVRRFEHNELTDGGESGIIKPITIDGLECIAECNVKLYRGEPIPKELKALYDEFMT